MKKQRPIKSIGRKRRVAGWTLLLLGLLVAGVWVASGWWMGGFGWVGGGLQVRAGYIELHKGMMGEPPGWSIYQQEPSGRRWWWGWNPRGEGSRGRDGFFQRFGICQYSEMQFASRSNYWVKTVLWPIPLLLWTPAALLLRSGILARRRANTGMCAKCGYSLAGLASGAPCPECGKRAAPPAG